MNIFTGLLFQQGYIQDPELAMSLAGAASEDQQEPVAQAQSPRTERSSFRSGAVSSVLCATALSPFR